LLLGVEETAKQTIEMVKGINSLMKAYKKRIRAELPKIYSQDLLNNIFKHPYTKIEFVMSDLKVSRPTATAYLDALVAKGYLEKHKIGKSNFYLNEPLYNIFVNARQA
jgi:Fic family protein